MSRVRTCLCFTADKPAHRFLSTAVTTILFALVLAAWVPARALTIQVTYDSSVTTQPNAAQIEGAINYVVKEYDALFSDNVTINITVVASTDPNIFGQSDFYDYDGYTYTQIRNALVAKATSASDQSAINSLPTTDPTHGGDYFLSSAHAKVLGLIPASSDTDGTFTFGVNNPFTYDPNNRAVPGEYDFIGIVEHEFSEIMGRNYGLNTQGEYTAYDLFRFSQAGSRVMIPGPNNYFSIDNGNTNLKTYNEPAGDGSDPQDWSGDSNDATNDSYNAFASDSVENPVSQVDKTVMDVIGYTLNVPKTQTITFPVIPNLPHNSKPFSLDASASSGLPLYYTMTGPVKISGNTATLTGVGQVRIRAHQDGGTIGGVTYAAAGTVLNTFYSQNTQTLTFPVIQNKTYPVAPFSTKASASSGLTITYTMTGPVKISGNTVTITGKGIVRIRAHQDGDTEYAPAPTILNTFTVN